MTPDNEKIGLIAWHKAVAEQRGKKIQELESNLTNALKEGQDLKNENEKLREVLTEAVTYIETHPAERIITVGERIVKTARKLLEEGE